jgi:hypothetical protein
MQQQEDRQSAMVAAATRVVIRRNIRQMLGSGSAMAIKKTVREP